MEGMAKQCRAESGVSHFHLSTCITLKDVGSQHGRIRGFTEEPTVIQVSLNLQEDEIPANKKKRGKRMYLYTEPLIQLHIREDA